MSENSTAIEPAPVQSGSEAAVEQPEPAGQPARMGWGAAIGGILNFIGLAARVMALATAAALLKEQLYLLKARMHHDAARARRLAEHLGQARVDPVFQAQALEVAAAFERVAQASGELADAADQMEMNAQFVKDAHDAEYGGVYEAVNSSPYEQPKAGFNKVR